MSYRVRPRRAMVTGIKGTHDAKILREITLSGTVSRAWLRVVTRYLFLDREGVFREQQCILKVSCSGSEWIPSPETPEQQFPTFLML